MLARDAQQQTGQQNVGQVGNKLIAGKSEHEVNISVFFRPCKQHYSTGGLVFFFLKLNAHIT